jgi:DnaJ-class molecular chaperone
MKRDEVSARPTLTVVTSLHVDCPKCEGRGELWTGRNEPDTNAPITYECDICHGHGELDRATAAEYRAYRAEMDEDS